jgi:hypothetical protein
MEQTGIVLESEANHACFGGACPMYLCASDVTEGARGCAGSGGKLDAAGGGNRRGSERMRTRANSALLQGRRRGSARRPPVCSKGDSRRSAPANAFKRIGNLPT